MGILSVSVLGRFSVVPEGVGVRRLGLRVVVVMGVGIDWLIVLWKVPVSTSTPRRGRYTWTNTSTLSPSTLTRPCNTKQTTNCVTSLLHYVIHFTHVCLVVPWWSAKVTFLQRTCFNSFEFDGQLKGCKFSGLKNGRKQNIGFEPRPPPGKTQFTSDITSKVRI